MMGGAAAGPADRLGSAIEEFLTHLRVERGLSDATLRAYRARLAGLRRQPWRRRRLGHLG